MYNNNIIIVQCMCAWIGLFYTIIIPVCYPALAAWHGGRDQFSSDSSLLSWVSSMLFLSVPSPLPHCPPPRYHCQTTPEIINVEYIQGSVNKCTCIQWCNHPLLSLVNLNTRPFPATIHPPSRKLPFNGKISREENFDKFCAWLQPVKLSP